MILLIDKSKYGDIYYLADNLQTAASKCLEERIKDSNYYEPEREKEAKKYLENDRAWSFLDKYSSYEYEGIDFQNLKVLKVIK